MSAAPVAPAAAPTIQVAAATARKIATLIETIVPAYTAAQTKLAAAERLLAQHEAAVRAGVEKLVSGGIVTAKAAAVTADKLLRPGAMIDHIVGHALAPVGEQPAQPIGTTVSSKAASTTARSSFGRDAAAQAEAELNADYLRRMGLEVNEENLRGLSQFN